MTSILCCSDCFILFFLKANTFNFGKTFRKRWTFLLSQELNYFTTQRKCLTLVWVVKKSKLYIQGVYFTTITHHYSFEWLQSLNHLIDSLYSFSVKHRKCKDNTVSNLLSRSVSVMDLVWPYDLSRVFFTRNDWYNIIMWMMQTFFLKSIN